MSDKVKLIVNISKHQYEICKQALKDFGDRPITECEFAIAVGTPLDSNDSDYAEAQAYFDGQAYGWEEGRKALIDDVKAEITSKHFGIVEKNDFDNGRTYGYDECLSILDNIGKAESEDI